MLSKLNDLMYFEENVIFHLNFIEFSSEIAVINGDGWKITGESVDLEIRWCSSSDFGPFGY